MVARLGSSTARGVLRIGQAIRAGNSSRIGSVIHDSSRIGAVLPQVKALGSVAKMAERVAPSVALAVEKRGDIKQGLGAVKKAYRQKDLEGGVRAVGGLVNLAKQIKGAKYEDFEMDE